MPAYRGPGKWQPWLMPDRSKYVGWVPMDMGPAKAPSPLIKTLRWFGLVAGIYYGWNR